MAQGTQAIPSAGHDDAARQAKEFNSHVPLDGAILTKLDGTAKGGIIFSLYKELGIPVQYIGVGEELSDFEIFDPEKYVNGLFGNGNYS